MSAPVDRELAVFSAARRFSASERAAYLDQTCAGDAALRQRVEELLRANEEAGAFLQDAAPGAQLPDASASPTSLQNVASPGKLAGDRIGHYKLLRQIGEGGCGVVYMAEQEEPVRRRVALKVIKLGMDTKQVIARFEAERQALALMDHPNIAKVLDAGATDTGRPYFVMELVRGIKITDYCDENNLSTEERLDLFIKVSQAVQHAHQKGIIHRDLKPSNILVADHDAVPVPKVIDFGIAKATTDQRLTDKTLFTAFEQFIGTPAYMSPEQARMSGLDIDTRTDIYSLGVLLYELLTGQTPFDAQELLAAGLDEMRRTISEREPARPSTRLSTMLEGELTATAKHRRTNAAKLPQLLRGDLDWIVMKALEKDRARRYETANGLAADIQRHLDNDPVVARPPSNLYRLQKLVRRNKLAFAAAGAVVAALLIGFGVCTRLLVKERAARQRAVVAEQKSRQVAQFLKGMLQGVRPSKALGRDATMLREILDKTAQNLGTDVTNQPEVEVEVRLTLAGTYDELGLYPEMEAMARQSLQLAQARLGRENPSVANSLGTLGDALMHLGNLEAAEKYNREALAMGRKVFGNEDHEVAGSLNNLAIVLERRGKLAEAESMQREALLMQSRLLGKENLDVAGSMGNLANLLKEQNKLAQAETMQRDALAMERKIVGDEHPRVAGSLANLASLLGQQGKLAEAETMHRDALAMRRKLLGNDHSDVAASLHDLLHLLIDRGSYTDAEQVVSEFLREAEPMQPEAFVRLRNQLDSEPPGESSLLGRVANRLEQLGKPAEAENVHRALLAMRRKLLGNERAEVAEALASLASVLKQQRKLAEAETMQREALAIRMKISGNEGPAVADSLGRLLNLLMSDKKYGDVEQLFGEILPPAVQSQPQSVELLRSRAEFLARRARWKEAASDLNRAIEFNPSNYLSYHMLAPVLVAAGDLESYHLLCRRMLERFGGTNSLVSADRRAQAILEAGSWLARPEGPAKDRPLLVAWELMEAGAGDVAEHIGKDCLILPSAGAELKAASELAEGALAVSDAQDLPSLQLAKGLAEYRQGHYASAVEWTQKALSDPGHEFNRDAEACLLLAMAQHQLKQTDEARTMFAKAVAIMDGKMHKLDRGNLGRNWIDWIIAHALLEEARALIPPTADSLGSLLNLLISESRYGDIEQLFRQILPPAVENQPQSATLLRSRAEYLARRGRWKEAAADLTKAVEFNPSDHLTYHMLAPVLVAAGDLASYRQLCHRALERFGGTNNPVSADDTAQFLIEAGFRANDEPGENRPLLVAWEIKEVDAANVAERISKDCLIFPSSGADLKAAGRLADAALARGSVASLPWFELAKALAEYRQGHYVSTVEWIQKMPFGAAHELNRDAEACIVLAMAQHQLKQTDEARATFAKGLKIVDAKMRKLDDGELGGNWIDWIIAHALLQEAKELIQPKE